MDRTPRIRIPKECHLWSERAGLESVVPTSRECLHSFDGVA